MFDTPVYAHWGLEDSTMFAIFVGLIIAAIIIAIVLGVWVYRDAEARGKNGALWLIIILIAGLLGLIIWLIVRPKKKIAKPR
jgi:Na+/H+-dicarboxylate symporter